MNTLRQYYVYFLTNKGNKVIYIGITNDLEKRIGEHKEGKYDNSFTKKYGCNKLVYFESYQWVQQAIDREKRLKGGSRQVKVDLINQDNPEWNELNL